MKKLFGILALSVFISGCSILTPKQVELFQDKVKAFPELTDRDRETQRQAAWRAEEKARETLGAALETHAAPVVVRPAAETVLLTDAVSVSVGPPLKAPGTNVTSEKIASDLRASTAKFNSRVADFKEGNNENAGKKIEGTGLIRVGYFTMLGIIFLVAALAWMGVKIYGTVNPVVGLGTNVVGRVSSTVLKKFATEAVEGGEWFKQYIEESDLADTVKTRVKDYFQRAHVEAQSRDTQRLVEGLTLKRKD